MKNSTCTYKNSTNTNNKEQFNKEFVCLPFLQQASTLHFSYTCRYSRKKSQTVVALPTESLENILQMQRISLYV